MAVDYDWAKEVAEFEETKSGVKGLVDAGLTKLPRLFVHPRPATSGGPQPPPHHHLHHLPTIDFNHGRSEVVEGIRTAAKEWGFFRIVNHGVPRQVMDRMLEAARRFHELPMPEKLPFYTADPGRRVKFNSNIPVQENDPACWRDILSFSFRDDRLDPGEVPSACREEVAEYVGEMIRVREVMAELLSEALGLRRDHLSGMECMKSESLACNYYPVCPEPEKTYGTAKHSDLTFLTILMQDAVGGLQVLHRNQWVDIPPVSGALIANIGDLMQIISNERFMSVEHRVVAQAVGPRVSVATFFIPSMRAAAKPFGPIKELLSEQNPAIYKEFMFAEYCAMYKTKFTDATSVLPHFKI